MNRKERRSNDRKQIKLQERDNEKMRQRGLILKKEKERCENIRKLLEPHINKYNKMNNTPFLDYNIIHSTNNDGIVLTKTRGKLYEVNLGSFPTINDAKKAAILHFMIARPSSWDTPKDILNSALYSYAKPRMKGQDNYIEVWVEKDALSGVLKRITESYHIHILVNRGYSSVSAMYDSYKRFSSAINRNQKVYILYLGDFDPSGVDMIRDIRDRIKEFLLQDESIFDRWYSHPDRNQLIHKIIDEQGVDAQIAEDAAQESWIEEFVNEQFRVRPIALTN